MSKVDLISRQWCDIVFEGRNKEYGAYRLRAHAGIRNLKALITLLIFLAAVGALVIVKTVITNAIEANRDHDKDAAVELSKLAEKKEEKKEEKKKVEIEYEEPQQKVQVKASIQFTVPKIVDDDKVDESKTLKSQEEVTKSNISIAAADYEGDGAGGINIDDLKDNQQAGGTSAPPAEEEVVDNAIVEVPASYPGGENAILAFVAKNLKYPSIALEQDLQGVVIVKFEVKKDGSIGKIKIVKSLSKECDQAAAEVVSRLHRFTPAKQQGHPVPVWFTLPIRFQIQ
ncbi:MAG: energy transducer TonB [Bacteroidales bacterium]|nr:energy transducer TonB [Bacteroidales bacterium]